MTLVLIGLGANLNDREGHLRAAVAGLRRFLNVISVSPVYETVPMYVADQAAYLNAALLAETDLAPEPLLAALKHLEHRLGRVPAQRFGPRSIDLDIIFHGDRVVRTPDLAIPHPRLAERAFVLAPAADIAPDWRHPESGATVAAMLAALGAVDGVTRCDDIALAAVPLQYWRSPLAAPPKR